MLNVDTERIRDRLERLVEEIQSSCDFGLEGKSQFEFLDRLRAFRDYCSNTSALAQVIRELPSLTYNKSNGPGWPAGKKGYALRWNVIQQIVGGGPDQAGNWAAHFGARAPEELDA